MTEGPVAVRVVDGAVVVVGVVLVGSGAVVVGAGAVVVDAGAVVVDAGAVVVDAGVVRFETGVVLVEAGGAVVLGIEVGGVVVGEVLGDDDWVVLFGPGSVFGGPLAADEVDVLVEVVGERPPPRVKGAGWV